ncbi:MAG: hypothetical protein H6733_05410 [Alphaproteobacteria bacterium]|nr:hypothetical protein [Alphaproteobacteria bacterium]
MPLRWWDETLHLGPLELAAVGLSAAIIGIIAWVRYVALRDRAASDAPSAGPRVSDGDDDGGAAGGPLAR